MKSLNRESGVGHSGFIDKQKSKKNRQNIGMQLINNDSMPHEKRSQSTIVDKSIFADTKLTKRFDSDLKVPRNSIL